MQPANVLNLVLGRTQSATLASATDHAKGLLFLCDEISGRQFLVDTGAEISVLPATRLDKRTGPSGPVLLAANGSSIKTYGTCTLSIWVFTIADVSCPLLGADFLRSNSLLVDLKRKQLMDAETYHSVPLRTTRTTAPHHNVSSISSNPYELPLAEFPTITTPVFTPSSIKHKVEHFIPTNGPPVYARARRLSPDKLGVAKEEFNNME